MQQGHVRKRDRLPRGPAGHPGADRVEDELRPVSGHEPRSDADGRTEAAEPRFAMDCMLGRLAKWLKILGYDTLYFNHVADEELVERARAEGRLLLTRDRRLTERRRARPFLLIESERSETQVREVARALGLKLREDRLLTRCLPCNVETLDVPRDGVEGLVPPYVFRTQTRFRCCPGCGRVYWGATHRDRMLERIRDLFAGATEQ